MFVLNKLSESESESYLITIKTPNTYVLYCTLHDNKSTILVRIS